jgi:hypothetical protein
MDAATVRKANVGELFDYLNQIVFEVESGRLAAKDARARIINDWGGVQVRGYVPKSDPEQRRQRRAQVQALIDSGMPERTARAKVTGR